MTPMNEKTTHLQGRYLSALAQYLEKDAAPTLAPARDLGCQAVRLGVETLALARIHEEAVVSFIDRKCGTVASNPLVSRAGAFFAEALTPIEETHRGALDSTSRLTQLIEALNQQKADLAASNEQLRTEILHRQSVEETLRTSKTAASELLAKSLEKQEELRILSRQIVIVQEGERKKISRELHHGVAQTLTTINERLAALKDESTTTEDLYEKITLTQRLVKESVEIVHRFAHELRPTALDDLGLIPALEFLLKKFSHETGIHVKLTAHAEIEKVEGDRRTALYRVAQEALSNVGRHSHASLAHITLLRNGDSVTMEISDDGIGFDTSPTPGGRTPVRVGILGMRERVEMVGGTFCVDSSPGGPTTLHVTVPCSEEKAQSAPELSDPTLPIACP